MLTVPANAGVCQVMPVTEAEAVTVSFKNQKCAKHDTLRNHFKRLGRPKKEALLSSAYYMLF